MYTVCYIAQSMFIYTAFTCICNYIYIYTEADLYIKTRNLNG